MSLLYVSQQLTIYCGFIFLVAGLFGNSMNIFIFSSVQTYRRTPCTFYCLVGSIFNNLYILINLTSRIASVGYGFDLTTTSVSWCRAQQFFLMTLSMITFTCACLAIIDQFLVTSKQVHLRQYSNIKLAHRIIFFVIIIWSIHGIPCFLFFDIKPIIKLCVLSNATFAVYVSIFILLFLCAIPMLIMIVFGCLACRNIRRTTRLAEEHADRQLIRMVLIQVVLVIISNIPYGSFNAYSLITANTTKDVHRQMKEYLAGTILSLLNYSYYVGNFYMFLISSSRFRQTVKDRIFCRQRPNHINPF